MYKRNKQFNAWAGLGVTIGLVLLLALAVLALAHTAGGADAEQAQAQDIYDRTAVQGPPEGFEDNLAGGDGQFGYRLNTDIRFADDQSEAWLLAESSAHNTGAMRVIIRDESGENLCKTGFIRPGWHLPTVRLLKALDAGSYTATAYIQVIDPESYETLCVLEQPVRVEVLA